MFDRKVISVCATIQNTSLPHWDSGSDRLFDERPRIGNHSCLVRNVQCVT